MRSCQKYAPNFFCSKFAIRKAARLESTVRLKIAPASPVVQNDDQTNCEHHEANDGRLKYQQSDASYICAEITVVDCELQGSIRIFTVNQKVFVRKIKTHTLSAVISGDRRNSNRRAWNAKRAANCRHSARSTCEPCLRTNARSEA